MNLIQLVPGIFPRVDGMGDYSLKLARQLRAQHGIVTTFLVCDPSWVGFEDVDGFPIHCISARTSDAFVQAMTRCTSSNVLETPILIQFSPYGYDKRGCPFWLLTALERYMPQHRGKLHISYHELEISNARPWSSGYWVPPFQRSIILRLAKLAFARYTHTDPYRTRLEGWGSGRVTYMWNFSSFGEPEAEPPATRSNDLLVFGRAWQRLSCYSRGDEALRSLCARLGTKRIIDIGPPIDGHTMPDIGGVPIVRCGRLPAEEVDHWMATTMGNFTVYSVDLITKSSVYQLARANGNITFIHDDSRRETSAAGLVTGVDFVPVSKNSSLLTLPPVKDLASAIYRNYQPRRSSKTAELWGKHLLGLSLI